MGILLVMMAFLVMMLVLVFFSAQKPDPFRSVNDGSVHQQIVQKVFQTCAGDNNCLSGLRCLYLADIQRIVVQAADLLGHQAGHGDGGPGAQPGGELPDGQGGRGGGLLFCCRPSHEGRELKP